MSLRYCASFDYDTSFGEWVSSGSPDIGAFGRNGTNGFRMQHGGDNIVTVTDGIGAQQTWIVGVAVETFSPSVQPIIGLVDAGGNVHVSVTYSVSDAKLRVVRGTDGGTVLGTSAHAITPGVYFYLELKCKIDSTTGTVALRINGATEISLTGQNTRNGGSAAADRVYLGGVGYQYGGQNSTMYLDDFYACDDQGSSANDFLGDVRVQALFPTGNGNSSQMINDAGNSTNNYSHVNEMPPNGDTSYVQSATVGDEDTYAMGDLTPTAGTVYAVKPIITAKKDDAGTRDIASVIRLSGTEDLSSDHALSTSYAHYWDIRHTKPGGGAWTVSDVNAMELGEKVTV